MDRRYAGWIFAFLACFVAANGFCGGNSQEGKITELEQKNAELSRQIDEQGSNIADLEKIVRQAQDDIRQVQAAAAHAQTAAAHAQTDTAEDQDEESFETDFEQAQADEPQEEEPLPVTGNIHNIHIEGSGSLKKGTIVNYIITRKKPDYSRESIENLIDLYFEEAGKEGINADLAIAQMLNATNFLKNKPRTEIHNYAGLSRIPRWEREFNCRTEGVRAHIQHLKGYASNVHSSELHEHLVDPRWNMLKDIRGTAKTLDDLSVKWLPSRSSQYKNEISCIINDLHRAQNLDR